jgi:hypothetical protein
LIEEGLHFLQNLSALMDDEKLRLLYVACSELDHRATMAVVSFKSSKSWRQEIGAWLGTAHEATPGGTDKISSFSARNLLRAFAGADIKPINRSVSWMRGLNLGPVWETKQGQ